MTNPVQLSVEGDIAVITIENPPVNALSQSVRQSLLDAAKTAATRPDISAIVIRGEGRTFVAGADIKEFGLPPKQPLLPDLINQIEAIEKPVVVALHGTVLGGGFELALGCHYRIAAPQTKLGLPEVTLGLLPGAGGTQRLPRLVSVEKTIGIVAKGAQISAQEAFKLGAIDRLAETDDIRAAGIAYAKELIDAGAGARRTSELPINTAKTSDFDAARARLAKSARGQIAPQKCIDAIQGAVELSFDEGLANERSLFLELMNSDQRAALIHAFFAERKVRKLPEIDRVSPREHASVGVVGGGTMGAGITVGSLLSGLDVTLIEQDSESVDRAILTVSKLLQGAVERGKLSQSSFDKIMAGKFRASHDYGALSHVDVAIEAVFETIEVKQDVFTKLDAVCKPGAILASNTSYLDVDEIAAMTNRPADVVGLHFFSPAHVMKLLEVVVGAKTAPDVTATGFALAKKMRKVAVRAGVCDGFIGNRILAHYRKAVDGVVLAGASPFDVDKALVDFGLAMGPFAVGDLAGLDIGWANRKRVAPNRDPREIYADFADRLCELGHFGRKTGKGYYVYADGTAEPNVEVLDLIAAERTQKTITPRAIGAQEIVDRYMAAMVNEAARVIAEGIALRPLDVDVTLLNGYGFPRWRGGPMHYADSVGLGKILNDIKEFSVDDDFFWQPAPLLERLVAEGKTFASLNT